MVAVRVCRDDSCPEKFGESAFLDMRIKEAGLSVKEMLCTLDDLSKAFVVGL
jgi:hypothetical protein